MQQKRYSRRNGDHSSSIFIFPNIYVFSIVYNMFFDISLDFSLGFATSSYSVRCSAPKMNFASVSNFAQHVGLERFQATHSRHRCWPAAEAGLEDERCLGDINMLSKLHSHNPEYFSLHKLCVHVSVDCFSSLIQKY